MALLFGLCFFLYLLKLSAGSGLLFVFSSYIPERYYFVDLLPAQDVG